MKEIKVTYKQSLASSQRGKKMSRFIILIMLLLALVGANTPVYSQTYEQARIKQIEKALSTKDGALIKKAVVKYSEMYKIEPAFVYAVIMTESSFNKNAVSSHGCSGLMQLAPTTFKARNVGSNVFDIEQNIHAGVKHVAGLRDRYKGSLVHATAAYNMGGGRVALGKPIPAVGKKYVDRVYYHKKIIVAWLTQ